MKCRILSTIVCVLPVVFPTGVLSAQDKGFLGFKGVVVTTGPGTRKPETIKADSSGGKIRFSTRYRNGAIETYEVTWTLGKGALAKRLAPNDSFSWSLQAKRVATKGNHPRTPFVKLGGIRGSALPKELFTKEGRLDAYIDAYFGKEPAGNFRLYAENTDNRKPDRYSKYGATSGTLKVAPALHGPNGRKTAFQIMITSSSDYGRKESTFVRVFYVLERGRNPGSAASAVNCPNLYGLGVNIGILELGALQDLKVSFLSKFLSDAIEHAKAAGCVPMAKLLDLQKRFTKAKSSRPFYAEITALRQELTTIINRDCRCAKGGGTGNAAGHSKTHPRGKH